MKYIVRKEMPRAIVGDILTTSLDDDLILKSGLRVLDNLMIDDAIAGGFIELYEEKSEMAELIEEVSLALGDLYQAMDKYRSHLNDFSKSFADNEVSK